MSRFSMQCPRCGDELSGDESDPVADAVLAHAQEAHQHTIDRHVVMAHLHGVRPDEYEAD